MERIHAKVSGRVQGVGFRQFTWRTARTLSLVGWVKNLPDGRVEVFAEGMATGIEALLSALARGPAAAEVSSVELLHRSPIDGASFTQFEVR